MAPMVGGKRGTPKARKLVDPVKHEVDVRELIEHLRRTGRVHNDELFDYAEVPEEYLNEKPEVLPKNRGINTLYGRKSHLRRRFIKLLLIGNEESPEGDYIKEKLEVLANEVVVLQDEIVALGGRFYAVPDVLKRPMVLLH